MVYTKDVPGWDIFIFDIVCHKEATPVKKLFASILKTARPKPKLNSEERKKNMKKLLSLLLAIAMLATLIPASVIAQGIDNPLLADFNFNKSAADGGAAVAQINGDCALQQREGDDYALYLDGNDFLKITKADGSSLLAGQEEITISFDIKPDTTGTNWTFYAAPNENVQEYQLEHYFAGLEANKTLTVERYNCSGARITSGNVAGTIGSAWTHVDVTADATTTTIYIDGIAASTRTSDYSLTDILGPNPILYLGKANWANGEYSQGWIDNFRVYSGVLSAGEILSNMAESSDSQSIADKIKNQLTGLDNIEVIEDIEVPTYDLDNVKLSWTSSHPDLISPDGKVVRPEETTVVDMTATIQVGDVTEKVINHVTVRGTNDTGYIYNVDLASEGVELDQDLYGEFIEDINFAADGGLYAELVQNRSFEWFPMSTNNNDPYAHTHAWSTVGSSSMVLNNTNGMNAKNTYWVNVTANAAGGGISNIGYDGISITKDEPYRVSLYTRGSYAGSYTASLVSGPNVIASVELKAEPSDDWTKLTGYMTANDTVDDARLNIVLNEAGSVNMDMISLFPVHTYNNRENGLRKDLVETLKELAPGFLRFPGGCIIEGEGLTNAYNWKDSVGDVSERATIFNRWRRTGNSAYYYQTYGLGFYEYFTLCEDLGCEPLPCLNAGISCFGPEYEPLDTLQPYIDNALDLIEFANGDPETNEWAALRAEMGHPEPFNLKYLEIGNEQGGDSRYYERYEMFAKQINEKYPEILLLSSVMGLSNGPGLPTTNWLTGKGRQFCYANDEHFYESANWFLSNAGRYDVMPRGNDAFIFAGEYACHYSSANPHYNAICEAAYMTGFERNGDVVKLTCYAPLFNKINYTQWAPDLIWFDNRDVFGTPSYWVDYMYGVNLGDKTYIDSVVATNSSVKEVTGKIGVGTWNTVAEYDDIKVVDTKTGEVLYQNDFSSGSISDWTDGAGTWTVTDGTLHQYNSGSYDNALHVGDTNWKNYTYTLRARKLSGDEAFIVPFLVQDARNYYHFNIGGWGNTYSAIEKAVDGSKSTIGTSDFVAQNNVWYDIKIVVDQTSIKCYIDGNLEISSTLTKEYGPVYTTASTDYETGDIILKVVNSTASADDVKIKLDNVDGKYINPVAEKIVLASDDREAVNSMANKTKIAPIASKMDGISDEFILVMPAYSFTILRIHTKADSEVVEGIATTEFETTLGKPVQLPEQIEVTFADGSKGMKDVIWHNVEDSLYDFEGVYEIEGKIDGRADYAKAVVTVKDASSDTPATDGIVSVGGADPEADVYVAKNENVEVVARVAANVGRLVVINENGKVITTTNTSEYVDENGFLLKTIRFNVATKGIRNLKLYGFIDGVLTDLGYEFKLMVGLRKPASDEDIEKKLISVEAESDTAKANTPFLVTVKVSANAEKIGVFNSNGMGISKSIVSEETTDGVTTIVYSMSVASRGYREFTVKIADHEGSWADDSAKTFFITITK